MPLFGFKCNNLVCSEFNKELELLVSSSTVNHTVSCDRCLEPLEKLVSAPWGRVVGGASYIPPGRSKA